MAVIAELARSGGDHASAFRRYEQQMRPYAEACQLGSQRVGPFYAPRNGAEYWLRNRVYAALSSRWLAPLLERLVTRDAAALRLPDYALAGAREWVRAGGR